MRRGRPYGQISAAIVSVFLIVLVFTWWLLSSAAIAAELVSNDSVCIIMRVKAVTSGNLTDTLVALRELRNPNWTAVLSVTGPAKDARLAASAFNDTRIVLHWPTDDQVRKMHLEGGNDDGSIEECQRRRPNLHWVMYSTPAHRLEPDALSVLDRRADVVVFSADERSASGPRRPCEALGCTAAIDTLVAPMASLLFSLPRLVRERRLSALALAAKQQHAVAWLRELSAHGWRAVSLPQVCVHMDDAPGLCWRRGGVWFDSPHQHERRCLSADLAAELVRANAAALSQVQLSDAQKRGAQCLRYKHA